MIPFNLLMSSNAQIASESTGKNSPGGKLAELMSTRDGESTVLDPTTVGSFLEWIQTILCEQRNGATDGEAALDDVTLADESEQADLPLDQLQALIADALAQMPSALRAQLQAGEKIAGDIDAADAGGVTTVALSQDATPAPLIETVQFPPDSQVSPPLSETPMPETALPEETLLETAPSDVVRPDMAQTIQSDGEKTAATDTADPSMVAAVVDEEGLPSQALRSRHEPQRVLREDMEKTAAGEERATATGGLQAMPGGEKTATDDSATAEDAQPVANQRGRGHRLPDALSTDPGRTSHDATGAQHATDSTASTASNVSYSDVSSQVSARSDAGNPAASPAGVSPQSQGAVVAQNETAMAKSFEATVMDQIVAKAAVRSSNGRSEIRIQLKPDFLGNVQMNIATDKEQLVVRILTDRPAVKEIIETHLHQLRTDLHQHGLTIDKFDVMVNPDADPQQGRDAFSQMFRQNPFQDGRRQSAQSQPAAWSSDDEPAHEQDSPQRDGVNYFA